MKHTLSTIEVLSFIFEFTCNFHSSEYSLDKYIEEFNKTNDFSSPYIGDLIDYFSICVFNQNKKFHDILDDQESDYTGTNICIFQYKDQIYKFSCEYKSYIGLDYNTLSICQVDPIDMTIESYEIKKIKESIDDKEFEYIINTIKQDLERNNFQDELDDIMVGDFAELCYRLYRWFNVSNGLFRRSGFDLQFVDIIIKDYDLEGVVFRIFDKYYMFTVYVESSYDDIQFTNCYIKTVTPTPITYIDYV
mgnify:CR=1 FL=1